MNTKNPFPGWQTVAQAVKETGYTRQRIHQIITEKSVSYREIFGRVLVPKPFPYNRD